MQKLMQTMIAVGASIIATGIVLDEAGKGRLGGFIKSIANKATRGYGV